MAIKQRALMKLDMTKKHVLHVMRTKRKVAWGEVYRDLTEARDLYREGLPRSGYAAYGEIYDGLILAVQKVMEGGEADFQEEVPVLCQELLEHLERETAKETRFKKEIFFLPYKLSMFDSLESVWRAADADKEHCNAYVMPIPYADRNPDQTVAAWHCERDQFPKDVPTLDWQQVDLKAWHPDIVVYHSPYDNCNAVTSVDEQYYSRNLRYCADKLVYIPYFVLDEIEPGDEGAEESIAHFITAPGVLNADLIVVQSEKMRQVYIHVLARHTNQGEEYWKAHVSGAGSPKIEKVLTCKKEDFEMPEKWRKLVEGRKVILYNTSLSAMLQNSDKVCDKLRYVFDIFRNRDDVVLWWRPHPLMKATFHSMRPQFEEEYLSLEKQYIEEGWGIYDDSSDLHRAICWSDAYFGDGSSVMPIYSMTGKPILHQDSLLELNRSTINIRFNLCKGCLHRKKIYLLDMYINAIFEYNEAEDKTDPICKYPLQDGPIDIRYADIIGVGAFLILAPFAADCIVVFHVEAKTLQTIPILPLLKKNDVRFLSRHKYFSFGFSFREKAVLVGSGVDCIVFIDPVSGYVEVDTGIMESLRKFELGETAIFRKDVVVYGDYLYATMRSKGKLAKYNLCDYSYEIFEDSRAETGYVGLCGDGEFLWALSRGGGLYKYNTDLQPLGDKIVLFDDGIEIAGSLIYFAGNVVYLRPSGRMMYVYSLRDGTYREKSLSLNCDNLSDVMAWIGVFIHENKLYVCDNGINGIIVMDQRLNIEKIFYPRVQGVDFMTYLTDVISGNMKKVGGGANSFGEMIFREVCSG